MSKPIPSIKLEYRQVGKYFEFVMDGEVKEKAEQLTTLMQKVRKYKIGFEYGLDKFMEE